MYREYKKTGVVDLHKMEADFFFKEMLAKDQPSVELLNKRDEIKTDYELKIKYNDEMHERQHTALLKECNEKLASIGWDRKR